jgi:hypothetical protein
MTIPISCPVEHCVPGDLGIRTPNVERLNGGRIYAVAVRRALDRDPRDDRRESRRFDDANGVRE